MPGVNAPLAAARQGWKVRRATFERWGWPRFLLNGPWAHRSGLMPRSVRRWNSEYNGADLSPGVEKPRQRVVIVVCIHP